MIGELKIDSKITRTPVVETSSAFCVFRNCVMIEKHQRKTIRLKEYDLPREIDKRIIISRIHWIYYLTGLMHSQEIIL